MALNNYTFYKTGYSLAGWAKSKNGKVIYKNRTKVKNLIKAGKKIKLYAKWKKEGKRRALILGETASAAVPMLDVTSMEEMMNNCKFYGEKMKSIISYPDHKKSEITSKIKEVFKENKSNDVSYIYMTCHGSENGDIIIGNDESDVRYYTVSELRKLLDANVKGKVVLLLDYCYSGNAVTKEDVGEKFVNDFVSAESNEKNGELANAKYRILCSSRNTEKSMGGKSSLATRYWELGAGWEEEAQKICDLKADKNKDNKITLQEMYSYAYPKIKKENGNQHMVVYPKKSSYIIFGRFQ